MDGSTDTSTKSKGAAMMNIENPVGLDGIEFLEFTSPDPEGLTKVFENFGFQKIGIHKTKNVWLFRQGQINLILNN